MHRGSVQTRLRGNMMGHASIISTLKQLCFILFYVVGGFENSTLMLICHSRTLGTKVRLTANVRK